jgi:hypothetical protein
MSKTHTVIPKMLLKQIVVVRNELSRLEEMTVEFIELLDTQRGLTTHEADKPHLCPSCGGKGYWDGGPKGKYSCIFCKGTGQ